MDLKRHKVCFRSACACVGQALAVTLVFFYGLTHPATSQDSTNFLPGPLGPLFLTLLLTWPAWLIILWKLSRSWRWTFIPFALGLIALSPSGLMVFAFIALAHTP